MKELIAKINEESQKAGTGYVTDKRLAKILGYTYPLARLKKADTLHVKNHLRAVLLLAERGLLNDAENKCCLD